MEENLDEYELPASVWSTSNRLEELNDRLEIAIEFYKQDQSLTSPALWVCVEQALEDYSLLKDMSESGMGISAADYRELARTESYLSEVEEFVKIDFDLENY